MLFTLGMIALILFYFFPGFTLVLLAAIAVLIAIGAACIGMEKLWDALGARAPERQAPHHERR